MSRRQENKLLQNLQFGLLESLQYKTKFLIEVKIEIRKKRSNDKWKSVSFSDEDTESLSSQIDDRLQKKHEHKNAMLLFAINNFMINTRQASIKPVVAAMENNVAKILDKKSTHIRCK